MGPSNRRNSALALLALLMTGALASLPARADTCSGAPVTARGEASRFGWLARTKARANWRQKVRSTTGLGDAYATWSRAANAQERCFSGPAGTVCVFAGTPCSK